MATKTISLDEEAYERLTAHKREGESVSDVVKRIAGERSWTEVTGMLSEEDTEDLEATSTRGGNARVTAVNESRPRCKATAEERTKRLTTSEGVSRDVGIRTNRS